MKRNLGVTNCVTGPTTYTGGSGVPESWGGGGRTGTEVMGREPHPTQIHRPCPLQMVELDSRVCDIKGSERFGRE